MKLLRNKTYQNLLDENSVLSSKNTELKLGLSSIEAHAISIEKRNSVLSGDVLRLSERLRGSEDKVKELMDERTYVNLTRDKKGVLHSINPSGKVIKRKVIVPAPAPTELTADQIVEKFLGRKIDTKERGIGEICGLSSSKSDILIGFSDSKGWRSSSEGSIIIKKYKSYWNVSIKDVISQLA